MIRLKRIRRRAREHASDVVSTCTVAQAVVTAATHWSNFPAVTR